MPRPAVISSPQSVQQLKQGFDHLADLLAVTLGPTQGLVLSAESGRSQPELLQDAATIARRVIALPNPAQDVGAMLLRNLVWRVHQRVGDGGATTAVLAQAMLQTAWRYVQAGASPVDVQRGIRRGAQAALAALDELACPVEREDDLAAAALAVTGDPDLSYVLGEMFALLGEHAYITIEDYVAPYLERVYLDGGLWDARLASPYFATTPAGGRAVYANCRIALSGDPLSKLEDVRPLFDLLAGEAPQPLLLVAYEISGEALNALVTARQNSGGEGEPRPLAAVSLKRAGDKGRTDLLDLALLSGAQLLSHELGRGLRHIRAEDLGRARRVEASADGLFVIGGAGDAAAIRRQVAILSRRLASLPFDHEDRSNLQRRLGRLSGSAAVLKLGAQTKSARKLLHQKAEQGIKALQATLRAGVVPGGGAAYLHCLPAVTAIGDDLGPDERMGVQAVAYALEAPFRRILRNAGLETPGIALQAVRAGGSQMAYDVLAQQVSPAQQAALLDPVEVLHVALETAASGAVMALSTETVVLKRKPKVSYEP